MVSVEPFTTTPEVTDMHQHEKKGSILFASAYVCVRLTLAGWTHGDSGDAFLHLYFSVSPSLNRAFISYSKMSAIFS